mgnify:CR=1 FL=1
MRNHARHYGTAGIVVLAVLSVTAALVGGNPSHADESKWTLRFEPVYVSAYGQDQHVMKIHEMDFDSTPWTDSTTGVNLETDSGLAYRLVFERTTGAWSWGLDWFAFANSLSAADRTAAADGEGGMIDVVVFQTAGRDYASTGPDEVLFYNLLEDNDLAMWTADFYGTRALVESEKSSLHLQFALRMADFDNDYRAVVGVLDEAGTRWDASSNYDRMNGPLVALTGEIRRGKSRFEGSIGQSVLLGSVELTRLLRDFDGPFGEEPSFTSQEQFIQNRDVAIPVTEFRFRWDYGITRSLSLGLGLDASTWWDVPVPPGVIPGEDGEVTLHENTIVFLGLVGAVEWRF